MKARNSKVVGIIISFFCVVAVSSKAAEGDIEWEKTFGEDDYYYGNSVQQTTDGGYIITGHTSTFGVLWGDADVYLIRIDSDGNKLWDKTFGENDHDYGRSVQQTSDGGYVIAGSTASSSKGADGYDVYLIKTNSDGDQIWEKTFGGSGEDNGRSVKQTSDGGYIIAGYTDSEGEGGNDVYLIKTDSDGNSVWEQTFGGSRGDYGLSVQQTSDGGYIIAGYTYSSGEGKADVYLIKTDPNGMRLWEKNFGESDDDYGWSVQQTSDGGYIIVGYTDSEGEGGNDVYLIKTDSDGNSVWEQTFGGSRGDYGYSVQQTTDGGYIIAGDTGSRGVGGLDVYLIKTDSDGNILWEKTFGGSDEDHGLSVQQISDGGYIIAGWTYSDEGEAPDIYLIKTDSGGLWEKTFGGSSNDYARSIQETSDGGYIIAGQTFSDAESGYDVYLIKTDSDGKMQWDNTFGGSGNDFGHSVQKTSDGGYIITGFTGYYEGGRSGGLWIWADVYLVKTDSDGKMQWDNTFGGSDYEEGFSVQQTSDGGYIIAGVRGSYGVGGSYVYLIKTDPNGMWLWDSTFGGGGLDGGNSVQQTSDGGYIIAGVGGYDVYLIKTDSDGNIVWDNTFGGNDYDIGYSVQQTTDGGYIIAGSTYSYGAYGAEDANVYLIKTDSDGGKMWEKTFGGSGEDNGRSVKQTSDGGYIITGDTESFRVGGYDVDVYLIRADSDGNKMWEKTFGGSDNDYGSSVQQTTDGRYIIAGSTDSYGTGGTDVYLIKTRD